MENEFFIHKNTPTEARDLMQSFWIEEKARTQASFNKPKKVQRSGRRTSSKTTKEMARYATALGFEVSSGNGRHGKHIEATCCGASNPLPDHTGRPLSMGMVLTIEKFFRAHERCGS